MYPIHTKNQIMEFLHNSDDVQIMQRFVSVLMNMRDNLGHLQVENKGASTFQINRLPNREIDMEFLTSRGLLNEDNKSLNGNLS